MYQAIALLTQVKFLHIFFSSDTLNFLLTPRLFAVVVVLATIALTPYSQLFSENFGLKSGQLFVSFYT